MRLGAPQELIEHHRRLPLLLSSRNSQRHFSLAHIRTCCRWLPTKRSPADHNTGSQQACGARRCGWQSPRVLGFGNDQFGPAGRPKESAIERVDIPPRRSAGPQPSRRTPRRWSLLRRGRAPARRLAGCRARLVHAGRRAPARHAAARRVPGASDMAVHHRRERWCPARGRWVLPRSGAGSRHDELTGSVHRSEFNEARAAAARALPSPRDARPVGRKLLGGRAATARSG